MLSPPRAARLPTHINRRPRTVRRRKPYCRKDWSPAQRLAHSTVPDPLSGCHIWQGSGAAGGYGAIHHKGRNWLVHRLAWTLKHGPIPAGMILCHRCDERRCCNPDHLFLGTRGDNMADLKAKRLTRATARADREGTIRIIYRGLELVGKVRLLATDPRVARRAPVRSRK